MKALQAQVHDLQKGLAGAELHARRKEQEAASLQAELMALRCKVRHLTDTIVMLNCVFADPAATSTTAPAHGDAAAATVPAGASRGASDATDHADAGSSSRLPEPGKRRYTLHRTSSCGSFSR